MVKDTEWAGPDGQTAGQRGRECLKIYRREEQRIKSRGKSIQTSQFGDVATEGLGALTGVS